MAATKPLMASPPGRISDDEPVCRLIAVPVSAHAARNGSHEASEIGAKPSLAGFSVKATALNPSAALRLISCAATDGSKSHVTWHGMIRSGYGPAHPSTIQSL